MGVEMFKQFPDVVGAGDLCKMLDIGKNSAYGLLKNKKIKSVRVGKKYLIPKKCVIQYIEENAG